MNSPLEVPPRPHSSSATIPLFIFDENQAQRCTDRRWTNNPRRRSVRPQKGSGRCIQRHEGVMGAGSKVHHTIQIAHPWNTIVNWDDAHRVKYLGSWIDASASNLPDIDARINSANKAMGGLQRLWISKNARMQLREQIFKCIVVPVLMFGSGHWTHSKKETQRITNWHVERQVLVALRWNPVYGTHAVQRRFETCCIYHRCMICFVRKDYVSASKFGVFNRTI